MNEVCFILLVVVVEVVVVVVVADYDFVIIKN